MKRVFLMTAFLVGLASAATWTLTTREAASVTAVPWPKHQEQLVIVYQNETGTILAQHDDWAAVEVVNSNLKGFVWSPIVEAKPGDTVAAIVKVGTFEAGIQGCGLFAEPLNDVAGVRKEGKPIAFLKAGTELKFVGFTRPTWYLVDFNLPVTKLRKEPLTAKGWIYGPYGVVK